jgi:hypothetical protein
VGELEEVARQDSGGRESVEVQAEEGEEKEEDDDDDEGYDPAETLLRVRSRVLWIMELDVEGSR